MKVKQIILIVVITFVVTIGLLVLIVKLNDNFYSYDGEELFDEISYKVPSEFDYDDYGNSRYYDYFNVDDDISCSFSIKAYEKNDYSSFEEWFKDHIVVDLNDKVGNLTNANINNINMLYIHVKKGMYNYDYYGVESKSNYYFISYDIQDYENGDRGDIKSNICFAAKEKILNTITVK